MNPFDLSAVRPANAEWKGQKIIVYGVQGIGKNTFAATFERPILIRTEDGAGNFDVPTFPKLVETFDEMIMAFQALYDQEHNYKTIIMDTLDWLEPIINAHQIAQRPFTEKNVEVRHIEDYGFGKGYNMAADWHRFIIGWLDSFRVNKGMDVILLSHAEIKRHDPPDSDPYDRYQIKLHKTAASIWQEWADMVLFCNYKTHTKTADVGFNKEVTRGEGNGDREIYTEERPAFNAKNHWNLPPSIYIGKDQSWAAFHKALHESTGGRYKMPSQFNTTAKGEK